MPAAFAIRPNRPKWLPLPRMAPAGQEGRSGKIEVQPVAVHYGEAEPIQAPEARSEW